MPNTKLGRDAWADLAAKGDASGALVLKAYDAEIKAEGNASRTLTFTISTGAVDRDKDVVNPEGWKLTNYRKNATVLWAHDYSMLPIAKAKRIRVEDGKLKADAEFVPAEMNPFAESVFQLCKGGYLNACSVGFRALKYAFNAERGGYDIDSAELYEFSIVPVPANPEALLEAKAAGVDVAPVKAWAENVIKGLKAKSDHGECSAGADYPQKGKADCPMGEECPMKDAKAVVQIDGRTIGEAVIGEKGPEVVIDFSLILARLNAIEAKFPAPVDPDPDVLDLEDDDPDVLTLDADDDDLDLKIEDMPAVIADALRETVTAEVGRAMNALCGRVD